MASRTAPAAARDLGAELAFLTRALKAPTLRTSVARLAERARAEGWTHEEFLAACLQREVAARESHGGEGRIRAARFPARKSLEEFDFDHARGLKREVVAHLGTLDFVTARENVVFLGSLSHDDVLREVRTALCVFYPADKVPETFGLVFAESNAVGTPVLAHPFGAAPELLTPEQLVDARDINAIIDRLGAWKRGERPIVGAKEEVRMSNVIRAWERILFSGQHQ